MKTYQKTVECTRRNGTTYNEIYTAMPDPKREGLYKVQMQFEGDKQKFSWLYGKKNQQEIMQMIKTMEEI